MTHGRTLALGLGRRRAVLVIAIDDGSDGLPRHVVLLETQVPAKDGRVANVDPVVEHVQPGAIVQLERPVADRGGDVGRAVLEDPVGAPHALAAAVGDADVVGGGVVGEGGDAKDEAAPVGGCVDGAVGVEKAGEVLLVGFLRGGSVGGGGGRGG